jgi:hypothetical protein
VHDKNSESLSGAIGFRKIGGVIAEGAGFVIQQQKIRQCREDGGKAHGGLSGAIVTEPREDIRSAEVGDEKQIGERILIQVSDCGAGDPFASGCWQDAMICKRTVAVIDPEPCSNYGSADKIDESILIEITGSESLSEVICEGTCEY